MAEYRRPTWRDRGTTAALAFTRLRETRLFAMRLPLLVCACENEANAAANTVAAALTATGKRLADRHRPSSQRSLQMAAATVAATGVPAALPPRLSVRMR